MLKLASSWMQLALEMAKTSTQMGEVPIGAVIVQNGVIIASGINRRESANIATKHAEIVAIEAACERLKSWRLSDCELYVTLEPCLMCAGAIYQSRIKRVVFGTLDPKAGALGSLYRINEDERLNHRFEVEGGCLAEESQKMLKEFFKARR